MGTVRYTVVNGEVLSENRDGVERDYLPDTQGNVIGLLDSTQTITDTFSYFPYGEVASRTGTNVTPFQFAGTLGYYRDSANRTYVRARTLNTAQGRWMTQDPIGFEGGDYNLYRYVENRPTVLVDPSGLLKAAWGNYCGPQNEVPVDPGTGKPLPPVDELDKCCKTHDECFAKQKPPCTMQNQIPRIECQMCNWGLCGCLALASCWGKGLLYYWLCEKAKKIMMLYACVTPILR